MSLEEKITEKATKLNDNMKIVLDEIERGVYKRPIDVFDSLFILADQFSDDVLALLKEQEQKLENLLSELRRAFVDEFLLADRYYEKNELQEIIKRILDENEKKFGELTK